MQKTTEVKKVLFKREDIIGISHGLQLNNTATKILSRGIRVVTSNKSIELDDIFEIRHLTHSREDKQIQLSKHFKLPTDVCKDLTTALIEEILWKRE